MNALTLAWVNNEIRKVDKGYNFIDDIPMYIFIDNFLTITEICKINR